MNRSQHTSADSDNLSSEQQKHRISEQLNPGMLATSSPTQEDTYWGRLASGGEEDYYWRRLTDNFYQKDLMPSTYLEMHNLVYEAYHANPLAFAIIEMTTSFVLGRGVSVEAKNSVTNRFLFMDVSRFVGGIQWTARPGSRAPGAASDRSIRPSADSYAARPGHAIV